MLRKIIKRNKVDDFKFIILRETMNEIQFLISKLLENKREKRICEQFKRQGKKG